MDEPDVSDSDLRWALANERFETRFQPIVRVHDRAPVALEALARLNHPARGTIEPDHFVPQMEDAGLALRLAGQVAWQALSAPPPDFLATHALSVAVNLPLDVLMQPESLAQLDAVRRRCGMPARCLSIELTESQPVLDVGRLRDAIERWQAAGYSLALDDVGPDMPRHRALLELPFASMKLDKSVLRACGADAGRRFMAETIAAAKARGLAVVVEGVEDEAAWSLAASFGADQIQGFLVARPLPATELAGWLRGWLGGVPAPMPVPTRWGTCGTSRPGC